MVDVWPNTAKSHQYSPPVSQYGAEESQRAVVWMGKTKPLPFSICLGLIYVLNLRKQTT